MADDKGTIPVTRREFYGALTFVWFYIALTLGDVLRIEYRFSTLLLMMAACAMGLIFLVGSLPRRSKPTVAQHAESTPNRGE